MLLVIAVLLILLFNSIYFANFLVRGQVFFLLGEFIKTSQNSVFRTNTTYRSLPRFNKAIIFSALLGLTFLLGAESVFGQCVTLQTITATGSGTFTVPAGVTSITVEVWGAGGAGGRANGNPSAGGGGSGGGYVSRTFTGVSGNLNYFIGQGGDGASGGIGASSWFQTSTTLLAVGGNGAGIITASSTGGAGAAALATGNIGGTLASHYGGAGGNATSSVSGGGGASAGTSGNGNPGSGTTGGTSSNGSTPGPNGRNDNGNGVNGNNPGSGGAGGRTGNNTGRNGGNGGDGQIRITYTVPTNTVSAASSSPTVCTGTPISITHTTTVATGIGAATNLPAGVTATWSGNTITISGTPTVSGTFNYSIPMTGGCTTSQSNATGTILVNANAAVGTVSGTQNICSGSQPATMTISSATGTIQWQRADDLAFTTNVTIVGTNSINLTGVQVGPLSSTRYFRAVVTNGTCTVTSGIITVNVSPPTAVGAVSANQTICSGSSPSDLTIASASGTIQWQRADNASFTAGVTNIGTNSTTLTSAQIGTLTATRYFRAEVTSGGCPTATSQIITVTVSSPSAVGAVSGNQTICSGVSPANMTIASATGSIQWQQADDAAFLFNVVNITGATAATLSSLQVGPLTEIRYFRAVVTSGACAVTSGVITVTVNPSVTGITPDQTVCSGTAPANMSIFTGTGNIQWEVATNFAFTTGVANISGATGLTLTSAQVGPITATRYYRARVTNPGNTCTIYSSVITVSIAPNDTASSSSPNQTVCVNAALSPITFTTTGAENIGTPVNLPPGLAATFVGNTITISGTPTTAGTYTYSIPLTGGCGAVNATGTITVNQSSIINDMSRTVCSGSPFSVIPANGTNGVVLGTTTYSWLAPMVTGGMTGGAAGTGTFATGVTGTLVNPTNTTRTATYRVTPRVGTCDGDPFDVVVSVNPTPAISIQNATICSGSAFTLSPVNGAPSAATIVPAGTTYRWTLTDNPNVTGDLDQPTPQATISQTLTNNTNVTQTVTYSVTPISGAGGSCQGSLFTVNVTVEPTPVIPAQTESICSGSTFTVSPVNGVPSATTIVPAGTTYTWTIPTPNPNVSGAVAQGTPVSTISQTLINNTSAVQTVVYEVTPTSLESANCTGTPFTVTVTINPIPTLSSTLTPAAICSNTAFTYTPTSATAGATFTWTRASVAGISNPSVITNQSSNPNEVLINTSTNPLNVVYSFVTTANGCSSSSQNVTVTVNPTPTLSSTLTPAAICSNTAFTYTPTSATSGATFTWTRAAVAGISNPAVTTAQSSNPNEVLINTTANPVNVVYAYIISANGCTNIQNVTVRVNPTPTLSSTLTPAAICSNTAFTYTPTSATTGATFTWSRAAVTGISNPAITTAQSSNPNETLINTTANPLNVVYSFITTANGCSNSAQSVTVVVNPIPTLSSTLTPAAICSNTAFIYTQTSATTGATFTWTRAAVAGISNPAVTTNQSSNPNEVLINTTANPLNVVYSFITTANGCSNSTQSVTVVVNPTPTLSSTLTPAAICSNTAFTYTPTSATAGATFTWTRAAVGGISNPAVTTNQSSNPNEVLINTSTNPLNVVYSFITTTNGCSNSNQNVTVTVNPTPTLSSTLTPAAICSNTAFTYTPTSATTEATFTWTRAAVAGISNPAVTTNQSSNPNEVLINTTANPVNMVYTYIISANGCTNTQSVTLTVNPRPSITPSPITTSICSGQTFSVIPANGTNGIVPTGTTYTWTVVSNSNVGGETSQGTAQTSISQSLTNTTTSIQTAVYTVTPSSGGCTGPTFEVRINVNPTPTVVDPANQPPICSGSTSTAVNFTGNAVSGVVYNWTNNNTSIGLAAFGTGNIPSFTAINTGSTVQTATITVTPVANGCSGTPQTFTITVNPTPVVSILADYCVVGGKVQLTANSSVPGVTWSWNTNPIQNTQTILVDLAGNYTATATSASGCVGTASISIAEELVINGNFTAGNTGFISDYLYQPDLSGVNNELVPDTGTRGYGVGVNGQNYHPNFWGQDHTNNSGGPRNMMIVNGKGGTLRIWEQTITVEPNTEYYFSAWAMSINAVGPFARLRFQVNGAQVGTIADLLAGVNTNTNNGWQRFSGTWNSGSVSGPITVRIVNLEPALGGNDFAIDDISFGTLSTFIELTSPIGTDNQTICQNSPIDDITYAARSSTAGPTVSGLPPGLTTSWNGVTLRFTGIPTASGIFNYTITTTGNCLPATATGTITVLATPTAGIIASDQTICSGGDPLAFTSTTAGTGSGVITYLWESNTNLTTPSWTTVSGQIGASYDVQAGLTTTTQYRRTTIATSGTVVCLSVPTERVQVTVQAVPTAGAITTAIPQTICSGGDPAILTSLTAGTGSGAISYIWESAMSPFASWSTIGGANSASYNPPAGLMATTRYRRITVSTLNGVACESNPTPAIEVIVQAVPTPGAIAAPQTICSGGDPAPFTSTTVGTGSGAITYRWESAVSPFTSWSTISGVTSDTYDVPTGLTLTTHYQRITISTLNGVACESVPTSPIQVTVQAVTTSGSIAAPQTICNGGDPAPFTSTTAGTGSGAIIYRWEIAVSPFTSWSTISGVISDTYDAPSGLTVTTQYRRITISTLNSAACESAPTAPIQVNVQAVTTAGAIAAAQTICSEGDPAAFTSTTAGTGSGTITYRWEANTNLSTQSWTTISGQTGPTYDVPAGLTMTTQYRRITISTLNSVACESAPTATIQVTVQTVPTAGAIAAAQTICSSGDPVAFTSTTAGTGDGTITYRWESAISTSSTWSTISGATGATYDAPAGLTATTRYRRITISTLNSVACESPATASVEVTVQSVPNAGAIAAAQTICSGGDPVAFTSTTAGTGDGTITYRWETNTNLTTPSWTTISGQAGDTYDVPAGLTVTTQYRRNTISTLNSVACESASSPVQVTVQTVPTAGVIAAAQTVCTGGDPVAFTSTTAGTGSGTITYRWEANTNLSTPSWTTISGQTGPIYDVPVGLTVTTQYRRITISTLNSVACESVSTAPIQVTIQAVTTAGAIAATQTICSGEDPAPFTSTTAGTGSGAINYRWENAVSPFSSWSTISGITSDIYDVPSGLTVTTQYRRITISTLNGVACESAPTPAIQITINPTNTVTPVNPDPTLCLSTAFPVIITHNTTGATGIVPQNASVNYNLPNGVIPSWNTGVLTISGTPTEFGIFNYSIPLSGGCGSVSATGIITVENPSYPIISINVVNPTLGSSPPFTSVFTVFSNELTVGNYTIDYSIDGINGGPDQTITVTVTTPGEFTFTSMPYSIEGTTVLTINSIQKITDICPYFPPNNNTVPYGVSCSAEFLKAGGNDVFYVPANIFQVRIQVYGDGLSGNTVPKTINVQPGGAIFIAFDGTNVFATPVSPSEPMSDRLAQAIVSTTGPNGRIVINYDCTPLPPCTGSGDVFQYTDSEGYTVIRFTGDCAWTAPDGLDEYEVLVVGGGGGGGFGESAGGGGGGEVIYQQYLGITMNGLPGLQNAVFQMTPGSRQGIGASSNTQKGTNGENSSFTGPTFDYAGGNTFTNISASGGGGGGSTGTTSLIRQGEAGASGGGGAALGTDESIGGAGTTGNNGGTGYGQNFGSSGAGGGGFFTLGGDGNSSGSGDVMIGGKGGNGMLRTISGEDIYYGAGGGGTSSGAISNQAGYGGSPFTGSNGDPFFAGGNGNNNGIGQPANTYGSGGGAGKFGGSGGFQGVIYIRYPNFRILPLEFLYFNAKYNSSLRSGDLNWATAKEWENDRFEIERSVNNVKSWETIGEVTGTGYSDKPVEYSYRDITLPLAGGNIFYRLKQVNLSGTFEYSVTRSIQVEALDGSTSWIAYPNPSAMGTSVKVDLLDKSGFTDGTIQIRISDARGISNTYSVSSSEEVTNAVNSYLSQARPGLHLLQLFWGDQSEVIKLIRR